MEKVNKIPRKHNIKSNLEISEVRINKVLGGWSEIKGLEKIKENHEHNRKWNTKYTYIFGTGRRASTELRKKNNFSLQTLFHFLSLIHNMFVCSVQFFFLQFVCFPQKINLFIECFSVDKGIHKKVYYGWHWKHPDGGATRKFVDWLRKINWVSVCVCNEAKSNDIIVEEGCQHIA